MSEYKINRESIKHLLETPPCIGVDITETPMTLVENAAKIFNERKHEYIMECIVKADIDPDALIKTAKKNQELMGELAEIYKKIEEGTLVEMPFKAGQTVYVVSRYYTGKLEIYECKINDITIYETNTFIRLFGEGNVIFAVNISEMNTSFFLTREEAEKALAERREG